MTPASLLFEPDGHIYTVDRNREESVTQVLEAVGISDFTGVDPDVLWWAQQRGTMVHRAAHYINQHNLDPETVDERIGGYVEAWRAFRRDHELQVHHSEHIVHRRLTIRGNPVIRPAKTDLHIIGTLDVAGLIKKHGPVIADIKTGEEAESWPIQLAPYAMAYTERSRYTHKRLVVQVRRDGTYKLHWFPLRDFDRDWGIFYRALVERKLVQLEKEKA